jgi:arylsulfatase A-like enzyme
MLTGLNPSTHRAVEGTSAISGSATTAAEVFSAAGYATGAVVASWFVSRHYGFDRGFDWFEDFEVGPRQKGGRLRKIRASVVIDEATQWLRQQADERFFLFVHLYDTHLTYNPPSPFKEMFDTGYRGLRPPYKKYHYYKNHPLPRERLEQEIALYDGEIRYVDSELQRLWAVLAELDREASTLVMITSDHGEEFFERGAWGHAHTVFDELVRIPLIVVGPGVARGRRETSQVGLVDLLPTLLESAGLEAPANLAGSSFWPLLSPTSSGRGRAPSPRATLLETSRFDTLLVGIRRSGWKLIADLESGEELLFSLATDLAERLNQMEEKPKVANGLRAEMLAALLRSIPDRWMVEWSPDGSEPVGGRIETNGRFLDARIVQGKGGLEIEASTTSLDFELSPGAALELTVVPVDARLTFSGAHLSHGRPVPMVAGIGEEPVTGAPLTLSALAPRVWGDRPDADGSALVIWIQQQMRAGEEVELDEETRERLKALGYIM